MTTHPYFTDKARAVFTRAGGEPDNSTALAAWAEQAHAAGDERVGVVITEAGEIVAHTRRDRNRRVSATYVTSGPQKNRELGLALSALRKAHGPVIPVRYSEVCQGAGAGR